MVSGRAGPRHTLSSTQSIQGSKTIQPMAQTRLILRTMRYRLTGRPPWALTCAPDSSWAAPRVLRAKSGVSALLAAPLAVRSSLARCDLIVFYFCVPVVIGLWVLLGTPGPEADYGSQSMSPCAPRLTDMLSVFCRCSHFRSINHSSSCHPSTTSREHLVFAKWPEAEQMV